MTRASGHKPGLTMGRVSWALAFGLAWYQCACSSLLGVDDYHVSGHVAEGGTSHADLDGGAEDASAQWRATCAACIRADCPTAESACISDPLCRSIKACRDACDDPACKADCDLGVSAEFVTLNQCVQNSCVDECRIGRRFECVNSYLPKAEYGASDLTLSLALQAFPPNPLAGVVVRACRLGSTECESVASTVTANVPSIVDLTAPANGTGFLGHFFITHPDVMPTLVLKNAPFVPGSGWNVSIVTRATLASYLALANESIDPTRSYYSIFVSDCAGQAARGVRIEVSPSDAATTLYYWEGGAPTPGLAATAGGGASVNHVPAGAGGTVRAIDAESGTVVASMQLAHLADHYAQVSLVPSPKSPL